jgi:hypothetical protein
VPTASFAGNLGGVVMARIGTQGVLSDTPVVNLRKWPSGAHQVAAIRVVAMLDTAAEARMERTRSVIAL